MSKSQIFVQGKYKLFALVLAFIVMSFYYLRPDFAGKQDSWWEVQSIDTVKYSRDIAREKLHDSQFDQIIEDQIAKISQTGATHIAIGTPYDTEFIPFLTKWVKTARKYNLNVWFRGNFSGWEGWFGYSRINRSEHLIKTKEFIEKNPDLFVDNDIFSSCPECENGGPGDPRQTRDVSGHRDFLVKEYEISNTAFQKIGKKVKTNYLSMNGDVARLIMDRDTTKKLGGIVTIDHYVASTDQLVRDVQEIARNSGGKVVLGEFGAPIPDIHGQMLPEKQAEWIKDALDKLVQTPELSGINYWTSFGSSTSLWNQNGSPRPVVTVLTSYFKPKTISGLVRNEIKRPIANVTINMLNRNTVVDNSGMFQLPLFSKETRLMLSAAGYESKTITLSQGSTSANVTLIKTNPNLLFRIAKFFYRIFNPL